VERRKVAPDIPWKKKRQGYLFFSSDGGGRGGGGGLILPGSDGEKATHVVLSLTPTGDKKGKEY